MLPVLTTTQINEGITNGNFMIDLSEYAKKKDAATKLELQNLTLAVANKLDVEPQHKHHISDIKQLQEELNSKLDTGNKYSYSTLISDIETIPFITAPEVNSLSITSKDSSYKVYSDDASGDLMIQLNDVLLATYAKTTNSWSLGGVNLQELAAKINSLETSLQEYKTQTDAVLQNHYDAILLVCQKNDLVEGV